MLRRPIETTGITRNWPIRSGSIEARGAESRNSRRAASLARIYGLAIWIYNPGNTLFGRNPLKRLIEGAENPNPTFTAEVPLNLKHPREAVLKIILDDDGAAGGW